MQPIELMKRAGGRKRYNLRRQFKADARRVVLASALLAAPETPIGELAHDLGVHRVTIWRDLRRMAQRSQGDPDLVALARSLVEG